MNREEFMRKLEYLLSDIPEEEKRDAIDYYRDYLEEAGEQEQEVLREFGSPERIAAIIRSDIRGDLKDGGTFTDTGYTDERFREPNYRIVPKAEQTQAQSEPEREGQKGGMTFLKAALIILAVIVFFPVLLGIGGGALGTVAAVMTILVILVVFVAALTVILLLTAAAVVFYGITLLVSNFVGGLMCIGIGLICLSFGLLGLVLSVLFYGKFIPWLIRNLVDLVSRLFHRERRSV